MMLKPLCPKKSTLSVIILCWLAMVAFTQARLICDLREGLETAVVSPTGSNNPSDHHGRDISVNDHAGKHGHSHSHKHASAHKHNHNKKANPHSQLAGKMPVPQKAKAAASKASDSNDGGCCEKAKIISVSLNLGRSSLTIAPPFLLQSDASVLETIAFQNFHLKRIKLNWHHWGPPPNPHIAIHIATIRLLV